MKLSFVIPAYNEEKYIKDCLDSIVRELKINNLDAEIIVVNNASTDKTREIVLQYSNVKLVDEPKKGLIFARQAGYKASMGELVANLDADVRLTNNWIKTVLTEFEDKKLVALSGPFVMYDMSMFQNFCVRVFYLLGFIGYLFNNYILKVSGMLQGGNYVFRRSAFEKIGGYNLDFTFYGEDTDVACRLFKIGKIKFTFSLPVYTSGRRLKKEGIAFMGLKYAINYIWTIFLKRPFNKDHLDIRS